MSHSKDALWRAYVQPTGTGPAGSVSKPDSVDVTLVLTDKSASGPVEFAMSFDGKEAQPQKGTAAGGVVTLKAVPVPNPTLWSTASPALHNLTVTYFHSYEGHSYAYEGCRPQPG